MSLHLLDRLGNWNPQLFRELKGRLTSRNVIVAGLTSIASQFAIMGLTLQRWNFAEIPINSVYCLLAEKYEQYEHRARNLELQLELATSPEATTRITRELRELENKLATVRSCPAEAIDFSAWWQGYGADCFGWLTLVAIWVLIGGAVYLLIQDLGREKKQGTLNFIQLSPQSTRTVLVGKLLGVPILVYGAISLVIPLHFILSQIAHIPWWRVLGFYTATLASMSFFGLFAILMGLFAAQAITGTIIILLGILMLGLVSQGAISSSGYPTGVTTYLSLFSPTQLFPLDIMPPSDYQQYSGDIYQWFTLDRPFELTTLPSLLLVLLNYGLAMYWLSRPLQRCFGNISRPLWSKSQSYGLTLCLNGLLIGSHCVLYWGELGVALEDFLIQLAGLNLILMVTWIAVLCPRRTALIEWARYRHETANQVRLLMALLRQEESPASLAIACNALIACVPLVGFLLMTNEIDSTGIWMQGLAFAVVQLWFYGAIAQLVNFLNRKNAPQKAVAVILGIGLGVPLALWSLGLSSPGSFQQLWLLTPFFWLGLEQYPPLFEVAIAWVMNFGLVFLCNAVLAHRLRLAGRSDLKLLLDR